MSWRGKNVAVLGLGESGLAMACWLAREGAAVRVADSRAAPPERDALQAQLPQAEVRLGEFSPALLDGIDAVAISPGLDPALPVVREANARAIPVTGEIQIFVDALHMLGARSATRIVAITGTNGKTTTTALTAALCLAAGLDAVAAGNISPAPLSVLLERLERGAALPQAWVLELSSFQLETVHALGADAATVLNVSDDHLDRYESVAAYVDAKARILDGARVAVVNRNDPRVRALAPEACSFGLDAPPRDIDYGLRGGMLVRGGTALLAADALPLPGRHNIANTLAAFALGEAIGCQQSAMVAEACAFRGLPHRVEKVARRDDGVDYFDDSKGTNVGATIAALEGLGRRIVLIAGGDGKGQDFSPLRTPVTRHARAVVLIGRAAPQIGQALAGAGIPLEFAGDMAEAVVRADALAQGGDAVLLSPACASFDMFRNYVHRAEVFIAAAQALPRVEPA